MRGSGLVLCLIGLVCLADPPKAVGTPQAAVRGKLVQRENQPPALETSEHKLVALEGDGQTMHVLHDKRLAGDDMEAKGHFAAPDRFQIDPFYTHAIHVIKDGKRLMVTYWCDVCSIRQYEPGPCWCCQRETSLDLREDTSE